MDAKKDWKQWTPEQRVRRTVDLAGDVETVIQIRRELFAAVTAGARFNAFLKSKGLEPAAWEGLVAGLRAGGLLQE